MGRPMTIGQLAEVAGVGVETIRYYQRRGLLDTPGKPPGSRRVYTEATLSNIAFIRRAQYLGFSLEEIKALMSLSDGQDCGGGRKHALAKCEELTARIAELTRMRRRLRTIIKRCDANKRKPPCAFIEALKGRER
jgi:MerR family mercuric resistance operon transcriptional regulator